MWRDYDSTKNTHDIERGENYHILLAFFGLLQPARLSHDLTSSLGMCVWGIKCISSNAFLSDDWVRLPPPPHEPVVPDCRLAGLDDHVRCEGQDREEQGAHKGGHVIADVQVRPELVGVVEHPYHEPLLRQDGYDGVGGHREQHGAHQEDVPVPRLNQHLETDDQNGVEGNDLPEAGQIDLEGEHGRPNKVPAKEDDRRVPEANGDPFEELPLAHEPVPPVHPVQLGIVQQFLLGVVLLEEGVDEDGEGGVQCVKQEEEEAVEEGLARPVGEHGKEQLGRHAGHVLVKGVLHEEC